MFIERMFLNYMRPRRGRIVTAAKTFSIYIKSLRDYSGIKISMFLNYFLFLKKESRKKGGICYVCSEEK